MKSLAVLYSFILVIFGSGIIFLSFASPHHLDRYLVISNWATVISFPFIIYFLNRFFYTKKYRKAILFFLVENCVIFYYCCYDIIKSNNDGLSDVVISLLIPFLGLLLSVFFAINITINAIKTEKY